MVQALSLQHQLSPRAGGGGRGAPVLLAPLAPASSLTFDTFAAQQHGRVLEATRAQDSYAAVLAAPPAAPGAGCAGSTASPVALQGPPTPGAGGAEAAASGAAAPAPPTPAPAGTSSAGMPSR